MKNSNLVVEQEDVYQGYRSVLASMTSEFGFQNLEIKDHAFNTDDFIAYIRKLRIRHTTRPLALFMDRLSVHTNDRSVKEMQRLNIKPVLNVAYSPEFNPIESVFSRVKFLFCNARLNDLVNRRGFNFERTIKMAFEKITLGHIRKCIKKSHGLLVHAAFDN